MAGMSMLRVVTNREMADQDRKAAEERQVQPVVQGLSAYVRTCFDAAQQAKKPVEDRMLSALRQRQGEYEPSKLAEIRKTGGSEIYMLLTETKARAAESWLRDILLDTGTPPWDIMPSPIPSIDPSLEEQKKQALAQQVINFINTQGQAPDPEMMRQMEEIGLQDLRFKLMQEAQNRSDAMKNKIADQFHEGRLHTAFNDFITDIVTFPAAFLKGPVVRKHKALQWINDANGFRPEVVETLAPEYERVDPFRIFPEPGISDLSEGYVIQHHRLSSRELADLLNVPGYDNEAIRAVLADGAGASSLASLLSIETMKEQLESKHATWMRPTEVFDALEFWGSVPGKDLLDWGMSEEDVPDPALHYDACVWLVGRWVIKAVLNYDPLGGKPFYSASYVKMPGSLWGKAIPDLMADIQDMANAAARALSNNMGLASGPQVEVSVDRLAPGEELTTMHPWRLWQTVSDPMGSSTPAIRFNQPDDRSGALLGVYEKFLMYSDDATGVPRYIYGMDAGSAGRTASGLSMLMGSTGKGIRQVVMHIDLDIIKPLVSCQYIWNMRYVDDPAIKGDVEIVARGAVNLAVKEQVNMRRIEFLNATANEIDMQIIEPAGRAAILREVAKGLEMPVDEIVPSREKVEAKVKAQAQAEQMAAQQPQEQIDFQRDGQGNMTGASIRKPNNGRPEGAVMDQGPAARTAP